MDDYGAYCTSCNIRQPSCCGLCTVCVSNLQAENDRLKEALTLVTIATSGFANEVAKKALDATKENNDE